MSGEGAVSTAGAGTPLPSRATAARAAAREQPLVSIGIPVYNGAKYLGAALESLLAQTYENLEILISDNASTDRTEEIGRAFAAADARVRYERLPNNVGPTRNFNRLVALAHGEYFKWAAHDDLHAPGYVERCVARLEAHPDAVLCQSHVRIIDELGAGLQDLPPVADTDSTRPSARFERLLWDNDCHQVFGLMRLDVLRRTLLIRPYAHGDGILLAELALHGKLVHEPGYLFWYRHHAEQSVKIAQTAYRSYTGWFNPARRNKVSMPFWLRLRGYLGVLARTRLGAGERMRTVVALFHYVRRMRLCFYEDIFYVVGVSLRRRAPEAPPAAKGPASVGGTPS